MAGRHKPNKGLKACLLGCGGLLLVAVVVLIVLVVFFMKSATATMDAANGFVEIALAGDDPAAYAMLHAKQRDKTSQALFTAHWTPRATCWRRPDRPSRPASPRPISSPGW